MDEIFWKITSKQEKNYFSKKLRSRTRILVEEIHISRLTFSLEEIHISRLTFSLEAIEDSIIVRNVRNSFQELKLQL